jgi:hypothetical protein
MILDINILSGNIGYSVVSLLGLQGFLGTAGTMIGKVIGVSPKTCGQIPSSIDTK